MKKIIIGIVCILLLLPLGCTSNDEDILDANLEILEYIPETFNPNDYTRGPRLLFSEDDDFRYCLITMGNESIEGGKYEIVQEELDDKTFNIEIRYITNSEEKSLDFHQMVLRIPKGYNYKVDVKSNNGSSLLSGSMN